MNRADVADARLTAELFAECIRRAEEQIEAAKRLFATGGRGVELARREVETAIGNLQIAESQCRAAS